MRSFFFFLYSSVTSLRVSQYYRRLDSLPHSHSVFTAALILFLLDYLTHRGCRSLNSQQISNTARGKQKKSDIDTGVVRRLPGRGESSRCLRSFILRHEEGRPDAQTQGYVCWMNGWIRLLILSLNLIGIAATREEQTVIYFKSTEAGLPAGQSWQLWHLICRKVIKEYVLKHNKVKMMSCGSIESDLCSSCGSVGLFFWTFMIKFISNWFE